MKNPLRIASLGLVSAVMLLTLAACNVSVSTANLSSLKLGKDKELKTETTTFAPNDTVYAIATVSNAPSKVTVKWQVIVEKAEGVEDNFHIPGADATVELPGSGTSDYNFPPGKGFPVGKYRLEVRMFNEAGEQKDMKSATYTVAGS